MKINQHVVNICRPLWHRFLCTYFFIRHFYKIIIVRKSHLFRESFYITENAGFYRWDGLSPLVHYIGTGWRHGNISVEHFIDPVWLYYHPGLLRSDCAPLYDFIRKGCDWKEMKRLQQDFDQEVLEHRRRLKYQDLFLDPQIFGKGCSCRSDRPAIAVQMHLFYEEMIPEFCKNLNCIPAPFDLLLSLPEKNKDHEQQIREQFIRLLPLMGDIYFEYVPNRGRDIAPLICSYGKKLLNYEMFCHIHTKKSDYSTINLKWRKFILNHLFFSKEWCGALLSALENGAGVIAPPDFIDLTEDLSGWGKNWYAAIDFAKRYLPGVNLAQDFPIIEFPQGSMFWARTDYLEDMLKLPLAYEDFPMEPIPTDGTIAHVLERFIFLWGLSKKGGVHKVFHPGETERAMRPRYYHQIYED